MRFTLTALIILLYCSSSIAQIDGVKMQSVFIYSFTKYIQWEGSNDEQFHIQVLGSKAMYLELEQGLHNKSVNGKPIKITFIEKESQISPSHILYVDNTQITICEKIKTKLIFNNTLLVTADFEKRGSYHHMNFVMSENGKMTMELHEDKMRSLKIKVGNELSKMVKHTGV